MSLPGYVELMSGATSECTQNDCMPALGTTLPEEVSYALAAGPGQVAIFASWEVIARVSSGERPDVLVVAGSGEGADAPAYPGHGAYQADRQTRLQAIRPARAAARFSVRSETRTSGAPPRHRNTSSRCWGRKPSSASGRPPP